MKGYQEADHRNYEENEYSEESWAQLAGKNNHGRQARERGQARLGKEFL